MPYIVQPGASVVVKRDGMPRIVRSGEVIPDSALKNAASHLKSGYIRKVNDRQAAVADKFAKTGIPQKQLTDQVPGVNLDATLTRTKGGFINEDQTADKPIVINSQDSKKPGKTELQILNEEIKSTHPEVGDFDTIEEARAFLDTDE